MRSPSGAPSLSCGPRIARPLPKRSLNFSPKFSSSVSTDSGRIFVGLPKRPQTPARVRTRQNMKNVLRKVLSVERGSCHGQRE
jgi:hypothetical protein